jgi:proline dehydrogenase
MGFLWMFARRFVAGRTLEEALPKVKALNEKGCTIKLDILGENVTNREEPERFVGGYIEVMEAMKREGIKGGISLKPTMLGMDVDEELCYANILRIMEAAKANGIFVRIDMEGSAYTQRSIDLVLRLHEQYDNVGIVIQAYLHRSLEDVHKLSAAGVTIRLCKGAYKEPKTLAIKKMKEIRANFIELAKVMFAEGKHPAIATHDVKLIRWARQYAEEQGIGKDKFEFQMLFGIRAKLQEQLVIEGYRMLVYVPFGTHWFPYFYRRLRERKENIWFVIKNFFKP